MDRARDGNDYEDERYMRDRAMDRASGDRRGYRDREYEPERYHDRDYRDYRSDGRRGRSGRYVRDRYSDYEDGHGGGHKLKLPREDMKRWGQMLMNADGTEGMHFDKHMLMDRIKHMGGDMEGYTEEDLCMAANMLYSDYCEVLKPYISREPEKEADFYIKMAKAFLDDEDAPDGSAKLAMYYFCIADVDE
jgi:hypothetical protein